MRRRRAFFVLIVIITLLCSSHAYAGIKVTSGDKPVFISSHMMGTEVIRERNGMASLSGLITGFGVSQFPFQVRFKTLTNFIGTARYDSPISSLVLTDETGKETVARYDFNMFLDRPGATYSQVIDWKVTFKSEGFYAYNVFVDGTLVGYYPFYVWTNGININQLPR
ncbi:DUF6941 family protein [Dendrosporobacter sp. 1207_IL3150]|uniref:DUF6941 family protein n=1 Tax=Dendrosporobacter sp. 1207_IL3150 TaxID=3084054 RepID=UPI002FDA329A